MTYVGDFCAARRLLEDAGRLTECTSFSTLGRWKGRMVLRLHDLLGHDRAQPQNRNPDWECHWDCHCFLVPFSLVTAMVFLN